MLSDLQYLLQLTARRGWACTSWYVVDWVLYSMHAHWPRSFDSLIDTIKSYGFAYSIIGVLRRTPIANSISRSKRVRNLERANPSANSGGARGGGAGGGLAPPAISACTVTSALGPPPSPPPPPPKYVYAHVHVFSSLCASSPLIALSNASLFA